MTPDDKDAVLDLARANLTPDELPADMEGLIERLDHYLSERAKMSQIDRDLIHGLNVGDTREAVLTVADIRDLLKAYQEQRRALEEARIIVFDATMEDRYPSLAVEILAQIEAALNQKGEER